MTARTRVLYLGAGGTGMENATGQTLRCLLSGLAEDRLTQVVYDAERIESSSVTIPEGVALMDVAMRAPVRALRRVRGASSAPQAGLNDAIKVSGATFRSRIWRSLRAAADISPVRLPRSFLAEIRRFDPEVIYTLLGNVRMMKLAIALSKRLDIPIVPHFMDDWGGTLYPNGELGGLARCSVERTFDRVIARSPSLICIGERMAQEYRVRFARPAFVAAYGVEEDVTAEYTASSAHRTRSLVYAGGLHLGREAVLRWVATALSDSGWHLDVYSPSPGAEHAGITYKTKVPTEEIPAALAVADALLFVESLDPAIAEYTRLSVSTKTAQYVAANRPSVLIGPPSQASIELLEKSLPSQVTLSSLDDQAAATMSTFLQDGSPRHIPSRPLPPEFAAARMRSALEKAFVASAAEWRERAGDAA